MTRIAVATTFPNGYPTAEEMLVSFDKYWPKNVDLYIDLDPMSEADFEIARQEFGALLPNRDPLLNATWTDDKKKFYETHKDNGNKYEFHVCRFAHKIFTLWNIAKQLKDNYDFIIWLDADVITKKEVTHEALLSFLPHDEAVSYLGRTVAPHSECGFVAYNMKKGGYEVLQEMYEYYMTDKVLSLKGWTDCHVFDAVVKDKSRKNLSAHVGIDLDKGSDGWNVWPFTVLGEYMTHHKGTRKYGKKKEKTKVVMSNDLQVKTKNCLPNDEICNNVRENLKQIQHWVDYCKPHNEPIVIASAGESLSYCDIKPWADRGVKIVTVKHAIDRLRQWGIKPWACVLLDPRQHVEGFVEEPDTDVIYFVASMVAPSVVKRLLDKKCKVIGYHAFVGAGEGAVIAEVDPKAMMVSGGSATATRSIGMLTECLGFKEFHLYGYDLCHFTKPESNEKDELGNPKYLEINQGAHSWGNKVYTRTFWTEGQLLAQAQELRDLYKMKKDFTMNVYGQGMAAWMYGHHMQHQAWVDKTNQDIENRKQNGLSLNEWIAGIGN